MPDVGFDGILPKVGTSESDGVFEADERPFAADFIPDRCWGGTGI